MSSYFSKNIGPMVLVPVAIVLSLAGCTPNTSNQQSASSEYFIRVSGSGTTYAIPDVLSFTLVITREGDTLTPLKAEVDEVSEQVLQVLTKANIAVEDIRSYAVQAQPIYDYSDDRSKPVIRGYSVSRSIEVTMRDPSHYDHVLDQSLSAGVSAIQSANYRVSDPSEYYAEALRLAMADARAKAQVLAASGDVALGSIIRISEHSSAPQPVFRMESMRVANADVSLPGQSDIQAQIEVVFSIE
ncbi:MAG TPA: SIMPL domain-containing protein [Pseudidiomarina sp.]|nr:SIMPL domain-containing protein [Pseudidiomarina sp.]